VIQYTTNIEIYSEADRAKVAELYLESAVGQRMQLPVVKENSFLRTIVFSLLGMATNKRTPKQLSPNHVKSVLIFRNDAIGDYILTTPLIRWLAENCPNATIDVVGSERNKTMLLNDPFVANVYTATHKRGLLASWNSGLNIPSSKKYDLVLCLTHTAMTKAAMRAVKFGKGAIRITHKHEARYDIYSKVFQQQIEHVVAYTHWTETIANSAAAALGVHSRIAPQAYITLVPDAVKNVVAKLSAMNIGFDVRNIHNAVVPKGIKKSELPFCVGKKYVVVNVSAFDKVRRWATEPCAETVQQLCEKNPEIHFFITGGPNDAEVYNAAVQAVNHPNCSVWEDGLMELVAIVAGATLLITPDTAVVHMAATAGVPVVSLYRKLITIAEWFPYNTKFRALLSPTEDTVNCIHPDLIAQQAQQLLWPTQS